jgi:hypothetical protein
MSDETNVQSFGEDFWTFLELKKYGIGQTNANSYHAFSGLFKSENATKMQKNTVILLPRASGVSRAIAKICLSAN